jgi:chromate transporter
MPDNRLLALCLVFAPLSLTSLGGGQAIIADVNHQTVEVHHWLTPSQFTDMFALARAAPGPTTLIAALIGWQVNGLAGAIVATLAVFVPSSLLFVAVTRLWLRYQGSRWSRAISAGLAPVTVGLVFAGLLAVVQSAHMNVVGMVTAAGAALLLYFNRAGPFVLIGSVIVIYAGLLLVDPRLVS